MPRSPSSLILSEIGLPDTGCTLQHAFYSCTSDSYRVARRFCPRAESTGAVWKKQKVNRERAALPCCSRDSGRPSRVWPPALHKVCDLLLPGSARHTCCGTHQKGELHRIQLAQPRTKEQSLGEPAVPCNAEGRRAPFPDSPASSRAGRITRTRKVTSHSQGAGGCHGDTWTPV